MTAGTPVRLAMPWDGGIAKLLIDYHSPNRWELISVEMDPPGQVSLLALFIEQHRALIGDLARLEASGGVSER